MQNKDEKTSGITYRPTAKRMEQKGIFLFYFAFRAFYIIFA